MNFSEALELLKQNKKLTRTGWNDKNIWIYLVPTKHWGMNSEIPFDWMEEGNDLAPWIGMKSADNKFGPWTVSQTDILAEDWEEIVEVPSDSDKDKIIFELFKILDNIDSLTDIINDNGKFRMKVIEEHKKRFNINEISESYIDDLFNKFVKIQNKG